MSILLSLDFGTNGLRAAVFDSVSREMLGRGESRYPTSYLPEARAEQDCEDWWNSLVELVPEVLADVGRHDVAAISVATFSSTVVLCDESGNAIAPAILWMDARASTEAGITGEIDHPLIMTAGGSDASEWLVPKAMWVKRNNPELWSRTAVICEALDYVNHRLTGKWAGSLMNATCKWNYDSRARCFDPDLFDRLGIPELAGKLPQPIIDIGKPVGTLLPRLARELSIAGEPVVAQGGIDAHMGMFGADTIAPGEVLMIGGTSNVILTQIEDDGMPVTGVWGPYPNALTPGLRMIEAGQVSAGSVLKWLTEDIFELRDQDFCALNARAEQVPPGANGLMVLDFWMGCRTPYKDPKLRGSVMGLTLSHDRAALYRAAVSGVVLGTANIVRELERQNVAIERFVISGGIVRNPFWLQATVDAVGKPAEVVASDNLTLVGGAAAASVALGHNPDMTSASRAWRVENDIREPDPDQHSIYADLLDDYRKAVSAITPTLHSLADRANGSNRTGVAS